MQNDKKIKYSVGASTDSHLDQENPSDTASFEIAPQSKEDLSKDTKQRHIKRHFGAHLPFWWKNNEPKFTIGPHWPFFICMWTVLIVIGVFIISYLSKFQSPAIIATTVCLTVWEAFIYLYTALRNPGIATAKNPDDPEIEQYQDYPNFCNACKVLKTDDIYHCYDCDVCIKGYDHHCPWTGKCIGEGNIKQFYLFLMTTTVYIIYCILITLNAL